MKTVIGNHGDNRAVAMYCKRCGAQIDNGSAFCPNCGAPQGDGQGYYQQSRPSNYDSGSIGWGILGFFFPMVGLILWLVWMNDRPLSAKMAGLGALVSVIFSVVMFIAIFAFAFTVGTTTSMI